MPASPPSTNGASSRHASLRGTVNSPITWPTSEPKTAITAASFGSSAQTQIAIDTMLKAKPDRPCTKPAITAPAISSASSAGARPIDGLYLVAQLRVAVAAGEC